MTEVVLGSRRVAGWGRHSEILMLPAKKEMTEKEAGQRITVSPAVKKPLSHATSSPVLKAVCKLFPKHTGKNNPRPSPDLHK